MRCKATMKMQDGKILRCKLRVKNHPENHFWHNWNNSESWNWSDKEGWTDKEGKQSV